MSAGRRDWILDAAGVGTVWHGTYKGHPAVVELSHESGVFFGGDWQVRVWVATRVVYFSGFAFEWNRHRDGKAFTRARDSFDWWVANCKGNP